MVEGAQPLEKALNRALVSKVQRLAFHILTETLDRLFGALGIARRDYYIGVLRSSLLGDGQGNAGRSSQNHDAFLAHPCFFRDISVLVCHFNPPNSLSREPGDASKDVGKLPC